MPLVEDISNTCNGIDTNKRITVLCHVVICAFQQYGIAEAGHVLRLNTQADAEDRATGK